MLSNCRCYIKKGACIAYNWQTTWDNVSMTEQFLPVTVIIKRNIVTAVVYPSLPVQPWFNNTRKLYNRFQTPSELTTKTLGSNTTTEVISLRYFLLVQSLWKISSLMCGETNSLTGSLEYSGVKKIKCKEQYRPIMSIRNLMNNEKS